MTFNTKPTASAKESLPHSYTQHHESMSENKIFVGRFRAHSNDISPTAPAAPVSLRPPSGSGALVHTCHRRTPHNDDQRPSQTRLPTCRKRVLLNQPPQAIQLVSKTAAIALCIPRPSLPSPAAHYFRSPLVKILGIGL